MTKSEYVKFANWLQKRAWVDMDKDFEDFVDEYFEVELAINTEIIGNVSDWIQVTDKLPEPLQTVWLTNGKGWTMLGCLVEYDDQDGETYSYHWAEGNGVVYEEDGAIVSECESDDLDVVAWLPLPKPYSR